jgi:hypothetical protein
MNAASPYHSRFLGVASDESGEGFDTVEVRRLNHHVAAIYTNRLNDRNPLKVKRGNGVDVKTTQESLLAGQGRRGNITAHHKLLPHISAVFTPETGAFPRLVDTVRAFRNQPLESVLLCKFQHLSRRAIRHDGECDMLLGIYDCREYSAAF